MDKTKIITFRLQESYVEQLDSFTSIHSYWKRTHVLVAIINAFFKYADAGTRFAIIRSLFNTRKKYILKLEENEPMENKV